MIARAGAGNRIFRLQQTAFFPAGSSGNLQAEQGTASQAMKTAQSWHLTLLEIVDLLG